MTLDDLPQWYSVVDFPPPDLHGNPCSHCKGSGITGEQYSHMSSTEYPPLLVDVLCSECDGCGHASHDDCAPNPHGSDADSIIEDEDWEENACLSCGGIGWNPVHAFPSELEPEEMVTLRVPCGCTESRVRVVSDR